MMFRTKKTRLFSILGALSLALVVAGVSLFGVTSVAQAAERTTADLQMITQTSTGPGLLGEGYLACGGRGGGWFGKSIDYPQLLADALGITVEDLDAAHEAARTAAIEQAVEEGLITREQADEMLVWGGMGKRGLGGRGMPRGEAAPKAQIDEQALLADALGITVEELQAARKEANLAAIEQAVEEGLITQEQADEMLSRKELQSYLERDALLAAALSMTAEELQAAYDQGKTLSDLLDEQGLDAATVRENIKQAYQEALAQAVEDGVITQEQADEMQDGRGFGFGMPGGPGGPGGRGGPGDRDGSRGQRPMAPDTDDDVSGTRFSRPGRAPLGDSTL